jgi:hypothetical protein
MGAAKQFLAVADNGLRLAGSLYLFDQQLFNSVQGLSVRCLLANGMPEER